MKLYRVTGERTQYAVFVVALTEEEIGQAVREQGGGDPGRAGEKMAERLAAERLHYDDWYDGEADYFAEAISPDEAGRDVLAETSDPQGEILDYDDLIREPGKDRYGRDLPPPPSPSQMVLGEEATLDAQLAAVRERFGRLGRLLLKTGTSLLGWIRQDRHDDPGGGIIQR